MAAGGKQGKRKRDFKAEYQRRLARGIAQGKTRQQARGHKLHEHIERAEHEREKQGGLTNAQIRIVFMWASNRLFEIHDYEAEPIDVVEIAKIKGYQWFKDYRASWEHIRREYLRQLKRKRGEYEPIYTLGYLIGLSEELAVPSVDWLYYH